jgi:hypothetical protein
MHLTSKDKSSQGIALLVTLLLAAVVIVVLTSLTALVNHENYMSARAQAWNQCIPVAEAGLEEALSLMKNDGTPWGWTNNLAVNGWSNFASGVTTRTRTLDSSNYYVVTIDVNAGLPKIDSTGYIYFRGAGGQVTKLARKVEVTTSSANTRMIMGLICSNAISLSGNVRIDSFDSSTNTGSTGGRYDSAKARDNVTVATMSTNANAIYADGSCQIWGYLNVGTGGGAAMNAVARAGSKSYAGTNGGWPPGVEAGHLNTGFTFFYPNVLPLATPSGGVQTTFESLPTKKIKGTDFNVSDRSDLGSYNSYQFSSLSVIGSGKNPYIVKGTVTNVVTGAFSTTANGYMVIDDNSTYALFANSITMDGGPPTNNGAANSIYIGAHCNVLMYTPGDFTITASGRLSIDPTSTLTIYAGGKVDLSGAGVINSAVAKNLTVYGLPTCTSINVAASANFIGSIYAPSAAVSISGASPFYGSCICRSASFAGSGVFHYDEALNTSTSSSSYYINHWQEVAP